MVRITIVGREVDPVSYPENSNTEAVVKKLIAAFGPGLLIKDGEGVLSETLSGTYEFRVTSVVGATSASESTVNESRKRRWERLNYVLEINKKAGIKDGRTSVDHSFVTWDQVKGIFPVVCGNLRITAGSELPQPFFMISCHTLPSALDQSLKITNLSEFISSLPLL